MSVVQTIMETIAKVLPDKEVDPLIAHTDYVGQPVQRVDGHAKVVGEARFTAEFKLDNLAYAALVHSTIAKGKIRKIDTEAAERSPGVLAVITHADVPDVMHGPFVPDRRLFAKDVVRFEGAVGRLIQPRQRQRRAQLERTRALFAGDGDGRFQITAGAIRVGGRTEKPRLAADAE